MNMNSENKHEILPHEKPSMIPIQQTISKVWEGGKSDGADEGGCPRRRRRKDDPREEGGENIFTFECNESRELSLGNYSRITTLIQH
jgi:hypothetical protein